jgi:hypothetical protein
MQRILLVAAALAAGITGCANPGPNNKPYTPIPPAPLSPPRPDQGFPTAPGTAGSPSSPSSPNFPNSRNLNQPNQSGAGAPLPPPAFPTGNSNNTSNLNTGSSGQVSSSGFAPRLPNTASAPFDAPPGSDLPNSPSPNRAPSDFVHVGQPTYNPTMPTMPPPIPTANQSLTMPPQAPQYGQLPGSVPTYAPITSSTMPPPMPGANVPLQLPPAPPMSPSYGTPTTTYPNSGARLRGD